MRIQTLNLAQFITQYYRTESGGVYTEVYATAIISLVRINFETFSAHSCYRKNLMQLTACCALEHLEVLLAHAPFMIALTQLSPYQSF